MYACTVMTVQAGYPVGSPSNKTGLVEPYGLTAVRS